MHPARPHLSWTHPLWVCCQAKQSHGANQRTLSLITTGSLHVLFTAPLLTYVLAPLLLLQVLGVVWCCPLRWHALPFEQQRVRPSHVSRSGPVPRTVADAVVQHRVRHVPEPPQCNIHGDSQRYSTGCRLAHLFTALIVVGMRVSGRTSVQCYD